MRPRLVEDGAVMPADAAALPLLAVNDLVAGDVIPLAQVVGDLPDRMVVGDLDGFAVGKDLMNAGHESGPFALVMEVVDHEEAAVIEEAAEAHRLASR